MTADSRTSEQLVVEALTMLPEKIRLHVASRAVKTLRATGRLAGAARATLTREQVAKAIAGASWHHLSDMDRDTILEQADAVLALMAGLVEEV